ncbi:MAG: hypothetical protein JSV88_29335 [Candidatus Aminicenantes bacterium]|nr:MAG: hypothetical protein JSV88_29335 [Candidatus Aminicenantes bacterium]
MRETTSLIILLIVFLVFTVNLNALMAGNESEKAYCGDGSGNPCPPDPPETKKGMPGSSNEGYVGPTIRELIIKGGGYILQSSSDINAFFNKIELSELSEPDYNGLQITISAAIFNMEMARDTYYNLKNLASVTPYNQEVIYKLIHFDYDAFQKENGLIPSVFAKVKDFLSIGDVTGVFNEFYLYTGQVLDLMYTLKRDVDAEIFPQLSNVWRVNQKYLEFKLFGQYVAQVFYSIK